MIYNFKNLLKFYSELFSACPFWLTAAYIVIHVVAFIWCGLMGGHVFWKSYNGIRNTVNTSLWLVIIITFPFAGILAYILFSFVPYCLYRKKTEDAMRGFFFSELRRHAIGAVILSGIAGKLLQLIINDNPSEIKLFATEHMEVVTAFAAFIVVVISDAVLTFYQRRLYVRLMPIEDELAYKKDGIILGMGCIEEQRGDIDAEYKCVEEIYHRHIGNLYPSLDINSLDAVRTVECNGNTYKYDLVGYQGFTHFYTDACNVKYNFDFSGTAVMHVLEKNENTFVKYVIYIVFPRLRYFISRTVIELLIMVMLFTPMFDETHMLLPEFVLDLFI